jgi:hypothetical protein
MQANSTEAKAVPSADKGQALDRLAKNRYGTSAKTVLRLPDNWTTTTLWNNVQNTKKWQGMRLLWMLLISQIRIIQGNLEY